MALTKVYNKGSVLIIDPTGGTASYLCKGWSTIDRFESDKVVLLDVSTDDQIEILFTDFYAEDGITNYGTAIDIATYLGETVEIGA